MEIRPVETDAEFWQARRLLLERFGDSFVPTINRINTERRDPNMYVAVSKGKVVGVCIGGRGRKKTQDGISTVLPEPTGKKYYIYLVAAKKKAHVGKALMLSHAQRARQLGFSRVYGIVTDSRMKNYVRRLGARKTLGLRNIASPSAMFVYRIPRG